MLLLHPPGRRVVCRRRNTLGDGQNSGRTRSCSASPPGAAGVPQPRCSCHSHRGLGDRAPAIHLCRHVHGSLLRRRAARCRERRTGGRGSPHRDRRLSLAAGALLRGRHRPRRGGQRVCVALRQALSAHDRLACGVWLADATLVPPSWRPPPRSTAVAAGPAGKGERRLRTGEVRQAGGVAKKAAARRARGSRRPRDSRGAESRSRSAECQRDGARHR